ncbi:MAG: type II toxin-antitoxin system mRNA interferase toxin, RelE/StbE family [Nanoarchaeota archaeon]|nr:type II toxin-antitoxin system mRNA interferase toxin, RelE/StbE family [Nanoarchaeota archaeon]
MYRLFFANGKAEKMLRHYIEKLDSVGKKLERLKLEPRRETGAHPLHGRLKGKWSCWLGSNVRMIYSIDELNKRIIIEAVGSHKIY